MAGTKGISVHIKGLDALSNIGKIYAKRSPEAFQEAIEKLTLGVERGAKLSITQLRAIDTGRLRASILSRFSGSGISLQGIIEPNTDYAYMVHEGLGSNISYGRRPYMERGAESALTRSEDEVVEEFQKLISKVTKDVNMKARFKKL